MSTDKISFLEITTQNGRLFLAENHILSVTANPKFTDGTVRVKMVNGDSYEVSEAEERKIVQSLVAPSDFS